MKRRTTAALVAAALLALSASGCYESPDITWYQAGEYKGKTDPLLEKLKKIETGQQLAERLRDVQTDR